MSDDLNDDGIDFGGLNVEPTPNINDADPRCGFFYDMPAEQYFADPIEEGSLSNSNSKILESESPLDFAFAHPRLNPDAVEEARASAAKRRGDIVHQLALGKGRGFAVGDYPDFRTNAAKDWRAAAEAEGKTAVLLKDYEPAEVMAEVIKSRVDEILGGAEYQTEVVIIWKEETPAGTIYMRGMLDIWCEKSLNPKHKGLPIILDPKITGLLGNGRAGEQKVNKHMVNMGWDRQAALYKRGVSQLLNVMDSAVIFGNLMIKPEPPFTSRLLYPSFTATRTALFLARPQILLFAQCMASGKWPGYPVDGEEIELPDYEEKRRLDREIEA